jgi:hypothetical protein
VSRTSSMMQLHCLMYTNGSDLTGLGQILSTRDEEELKQFDLNMAYGPCLGMSRKERCAQGH